MSAGKKLGLVLAGVAALAALVLLFLKLLPSGPKEQSARVGAAPTPARPVKPPEKAVEPPPPARPRTAGLLLWGPGLDSNASRLAVQLQAVGVRLCIVAGELRVPRFSGRVSVEEVIKGVAGLSGCRAEWFDDGAEIVLWREAPRDEEARILADIGLREPARRVGAAWDAVACGEDPRLAVKALAAAASDPEHMLPELVGRMSWPAAGEGRWEAARLFGEKEIRPFFENALRHDDDEVREEAARILGAMSGEWVERTLRVTAVGEHSNVRRAALEALVRSAGKRSWDALLLALEDRATGVRKDAARHVGVLGGPGNVPFLLEIYEKNAHSDVRWGVADGLAEIGGPEAVEALIKILREEPSPGQRYLTTAMMSHMHPDLAPAMAVALGDPEKRVWSDALDPASFGTREGRDLMLAKLATEKDAARAAAIADALDHYLVRDPLVHRALVKAGKRPPERIGDSDTILPARLSGPPKVGEPPELGLTEEFSERGREVLETKLHGPGLAREIELFALQLRAVGLRAVFLTPYRRVPAFDGALAVREAAERVAAANQCRLAWRSGGEEALFYVPTADAELRALAGRLASKDAAARQLAVYEACAYALDPRETVLAVRAAVQCGGEEAEAALAALDDRTCWWADQSLRGDFGGRARWGFAVRLDPAAALELCRAGLRTSSNWSWWRKLAAAKLAGLDGPEALAELRRLAREDFDDPGNCAREALVRTMGEKFVAEMVSLLPRAPAWIRDDLARHLGSAGSGEATSALIAMLGQAAADPKQDHRDETLAGIMDGLLATRTDRGREAFLGALKHADPAVRRAAALAAPALGRVRALELLAPLLEDADEKVRETTAAALARIGGPRARDLLIARIAKLPEAAQPQAREWLKNAFRNDPVAGAAAAPPKPGPVAPPPEPEVF